MNDAQKAGLIVDWIGRQCTMTLHSMGIELGRPKTVFESLEKIFRTESNQTLSQFKFWGLKQKSGQSCDGYMSEVGLVIAECRYPDQVQNQLLKDQYIFELAIKEIQDHLLGEIVSEDSAEKCLLESRKVESKIEQRKLLGIKTVMTYNSIHRGRYKYRSKSQGRGQSSSSICNCKYCDKSHSKGNCPAFGKKCQKCGCENHFRLMCINTNTEKCEPSRHRPKKSHKRKRFYKVSEQKDNGMDDLADQVQSLFYNDIHFNSINTRMHTSIECKTPGGNLSRKTFKVDTGADGNLMPISIFMQLFPKLSLETLSKTVEKGMTLYAYNNNL